MLELLQGRAESEEPPLETRQAASETFSKTVELSRRQSRRRQLISGALLLCLTALAVFLHYFPVYRMAQVWWPSWYETGEISLLAYIGSREDRQAAQPVMALAELAFSDLDLTCQEAQARYGALSRYCFPRDYYPEVAREEHTLELWSAHFSGSYGQMWVYYSQAGYDETGAPRTGSSRIPALWYLEQTRDGAWEVVGIKEHP